MAKQGIEWVITPSAGIGSKIARATSQMRPAINALAQSHAARGEATMKAGAPWNDQTGHARGSLYGRAEGTNVELGTTNAEYGIYLELGTSRMAPRPIIEPTAREAAPEYFEDAADLVARLLGGK
jgi:HK97 gp10 family phage protein